MNFTISFKIKNKTAVKFILKIEVNITRCLSMKISIVLNLQQNVLASILPDLFALKIPCFLNFLLSCINDILGLEEETTNTHRN